MPKKIEAKLKKAARLKKLGRERTAAYVYGTMRNLGWKPMRRKHAR